MSATNTPAISQTQATSDMLPQLLTSVEKDLLQHIITNLRDRRMNVGEAQKLAHEFLSLLPMADKEDLLQKLNTLGQTYVSAREVYAQYAAPHEEEKRQKLLTAMREHIKSGNIEQAIAVAKGEVPHE